ncbi:D-sedoheptulose-7-phosphate isomerase [Pelagicoccus mobilis]|uniref:SIS domain-containing protein n=1 Tax=Pelagicoccus mobilis TaxID=415221 RepID=A0A934VRT5_9BACT|nr:SIS domain-containing protein [Pelagicoccus mobilis]MBK1877819.1 SIS domain-containing protein [Pelagicoccus mobilis]
MHPILTELIERYPILAPISDEIEGAFERLIACYENDGVVYICGNGGSAADAEHIVGELMKAFTVKRPLAESFDDPYLNDNLEAGLRAFSLVSQTCLATAFANDVAPDLVFAQQVAGYGRSGDLLWALSTSGNSKNVIHALKVARAKQMDTLGMTGKSGGKMNDLCSVCLRMPESETYKIQELHLPVYHALCRMLESHFFPTND